MKRIINPYNDDENRCFGCSKQNPLGLKLNFFEKDEYLEAVWQPSEYYQGYPNVLHGGIISTLLDELGAWCISVKAGTAGVTTEMNIRYLSPVYLSKGEISMSARIIDQDGKNASVRCQMFDSHAKLCAEAHLVFFLYPEDVAKSRFRYPGREAFYEKETGPDLSAP
jgi:uncharacterized protein (TIGR00369 family)